MDVCVCWMLDEVVVVVQSFGHPEVELQSVIIFTKDE